MKTNHTTKKDTEQYNDYFLFIPNLLLVALVPLIVYLKVIPIDRTITPFFDNKTKNPDFFSYYKSICIIVLSSLSIISAAISAFRKRIKLKKLHLIYIPIAIYAVCIILSAADSKYPGVAIYGFPDRYEGMLVLLSYIAAFISTIALTNNEKQVKFLLAGITFAAAIIGIIGLFQYLGFDIFKTETGRMLILSPEYRDEIGSIKSSNESAAIYSTLYNPNNLGMYMCMAFSLSLCLFVFVNGKVKKILSGLFSCLMFINLLGSNSRGSYIGALIAILLILVLIRKNLRRNWKRLTAIIAMYALVFAAFNSLGGGSIGSRLGSLLNGHDIHAEDSSIDKIKGFDIADNRLSLHCTNSLLSIITKDSKINFYDDKNNALSLIPSGDSKGYSFSHEAYKDYLILISNNMLKIQKGKSYLYFAIVDGKFLFLNSRGEAVKNSQTEAFGFSGMERLGSGRGYIWSRTLPLIKNSIFLGHGPDTFAMYFPQNDYMGKLKYMYDANITLDKPHNMYLQAAVNTGLPSLLAILFLFSVYWFGSIRLLVKNRFNDFFSAAGLAVLAAITGYMAAGMFADSTVSVSPTFWVLLGLGISINYLHATEYN